MILQALKHLKRMSVTLSAIDCAVAIAVETIVTAQPTSLL